MKSETENSAPSATEPDQDSPTSNAGGAVEGRSVFAVDTSAAGIVVRTLFLSEDGHLLDMPAVFPNLGYALNQIDHLRQIVIDRFEKAAQVGVQVIAANSQKKEGGDTEPSPIS